MTPYQKETNQSLVQNYGQGKNRQLVRLFTGAGKTTWVAAKLPAFFPELAKHGLLFISHRREILYHSYKTFEQIFKGEKWCGIDMGEMEATGFEDFLFVSVDSLGRLQSNRILKYKRRTPGIIVVDEAHHAEAEGIWDNILNFFGVGSDQSQHYTLPGSSDKPLLVFLTATPRPERAMPFIDCVAADYGIKYGIQNGWLTDIKMYRASPRRSDYEKWEEDEQVDFLIKTWKDYTPDMRTLVFARKVAQSELLANTLNKYDICSAGHVDAKTHPDARKILVDRFGKPYDDPDALTVMSNRLIFTEGYDNRYIQCILDNAPTKNTRTVIQKVGRGLRPSPDANIYEVDTPEARREAIRKSSKPHLTYVTTFPLEHDLDMPTVLFNVPKEVKAEGHLLITEIVDIIENEEAEMPEAPTRDAAEINSIDVRMARIDVWTQTIYNNDLVTVSPLRWTTSDSNKYAAILLPTNVTTDSVYEQTPTIILYERIGDVVKGKTITYGGWNEAVGHAVKSKVRDIPKHYNSLTEAIQATDRALKKYNIFRELQRADTGMADEKTKNYLKRAKVRCNYDNLTAETAAVLVDDYKIRRKLEEFGLVWG